MKRLLASLIVIAFGTATAQAHFIWIVPDKQGTTAQVVFSETPEPDDPGLLDKIAKTQLFLRHADKEVSLKWTKGKEAFHVALPGTGLRTVGGVCFYGVLKKDEADPFLLMYYAKAHVAGSGNHLPWGRLPLEIVQVEGKFQVLWQGKPLAGAEVVCSLPGQEKQEKRMTDKSGTFDLGTLKVGVCGIRAKHVEMKEGENDGKKFKEIRHYSTLVIQVAEKQTGKAKADPLATKLLADARAARAQWEKFPGFTADIEINFDGKISRGKVAVEATGKVSVNKLDGDAEAWAKRQLGSIVAHRIDDSASLNTPCAFSDGEANHPLGRAITILNDELHSSYRVRDRQIIVVNRLMNTARFSITVLENRTNKEGKFLPASYVVHYWNTKSGDLDKTESHSQTWVRVEAFDLPVAAYVITATKNLSTRSLTLSGHKLTKNVTRN
jgi:hypothetical protein